MHGSENRPWGPLVWDNHASVHKPVHATLLFLSLLPFGHFVPFQGLEKQGEEKEPLPAPTILADRYN